MKSLPMTNSIPKLTRKFQSGMTLIELMVGMVISLLIILAATTVYIAGKENFRTNDDRTRNLETGRLAVDLLARNLRMAGSYNYNVANPSQRKGLPITAGSAVQGIDGGAGPDTLTIRYENHATMLFNPATLVGADCLGQNPGGLVVANTFSVSANGQLQCLGNGGAAAQPIVSSVADFQVTYNVDLNVENDSAFKGFSDETPEAPIVQNVPATGVTNWHAVRSVEICLDVVSFDPNTSQGSTPGMNCRGAAFPSDNRVHRIYRTLVNVRNATRGSNSRNADGTLSP